MRKNVCDFLFNTPEFLWVPFVCVIHFISSSSGERKKKTPSFCVCFCVLKKTLGFNQEFLVEGKTPVTKTG